MYMVGMPTSGCLTCGRQGAHGGEEKEKAGQAEKKTVEEREQQLRERGLEGPLKPGFDRPVMIHRAVFGSLERFSAILSEHFAGRWPFFLNPRQVMVVPVHHLKHNEYSDYVASQMRKVGGLYAESNTDKGGNMKKKIAQAIEARYSFIAVVGDEDSQNLTVTLRARDDGEASMLLSNAENKQENRLVFPLAECIERLKRLNMPCSQDVESFDEWEGVDPKVAAANFRSAAALGGYPNPA